MSMCVRAQVYNRLLQHALADPERLSTHPAACATRFRLLQLALLHCSHCLRNLPAGQPCPAALELLHHRVLAAGLLWFTHAPSYSARMTQRQADEQYTAVAGFAEALGALAAAGEKSKRGAWPATPVQPAYSAALHGPSGVEHGEPCMAHACPCRTSALYQAASQHSSYLRWQHGCCKHPAGGLPVPSCCPTLLTPS